MYTVQGTDYAIASEAGPVFARRPSALFTTCPFNATKLSPFYYKAPPDMEACCMDLEFEVTICTLRRLSRLPIFDHRNVPEASEAMWANWAPVPLSPEQEDQLAKDAESYVATFLSRPDLLGYPSLDPAVGPNSSRAWAVPSYIYLQVVVRNVAIDANFLMWLLDQLRQDLVRTEEAVTIGAYSRDVWLWKAVLGNVAVEMLSRGSEAPDPGIAHAMREWYPEKLRAAYAMFDPYLADWQSVKRALRKVAWVREFANESVPREQWQRVMREMAEEEDDEEEGDDEGEEEDSENTSMSE
jgi:hypothetical protein